MGWGGGTHVIEHRSQDPGEGNPIDDGSQAAAAMGEADAGVVRKPVAHPRVHVKLAPRIGGCLLARRRDEQHQERRPRAEGVGRRRRHSHEEIVMESD